MKIIRTTLILIVIDLMAFFSILKIGDSNNLLWWIEILLILGIIPLLYIAIDKISKVLFIHEKAFIQLNKNKKEEYHLRFNEIISQNKMINEEIRDAIITLSNSQNSTYVNISKQQSETRKDIESLNNNNISMNENINKLLDKEQDFISAIGNNISVLKENYENLSKFFMNSSEEGNKLLKGFSNLSVTFFEEIKENNFENFNELQRHLMENNSNIQEDIGKLSVLFDDTLNSFAEKSDKIIDSCNRQLSKDIEKSIKDMYKKIKEENENWKQVTEILSKNNADSIKEIHSLVSQMYKLHDDLLKQIDEKQSKMMELSEADIKLMRDIIK